MRMHGEILSKKNTKQITSDQRSCNIMVGFKHCGQVTPLWSFIAAAKAQKVSHFLSPLY